MRALPDELSPVTREVHGHRSKHHVSVFKCEMMLALSSSSDYNPLSRDVTHFFTKVSGGIVKAKQRYNCCAKLTTSKCIKWSRCRSPELHVACGIARLQCYLSFEA